MEGTAMAKPNHSKETTSPKVAKLASDVLSGKIKPTPAQAKTLAGSVLTQSPGKKGK
jgi:hypothetical protein